MLRPRYTNYTRNKTSVNISRRKKKAYKVFNMLPNQLKTTYMTVFKKSKNIKYKHAQ